MWVGDTILDSAGQSMDGAGEIGMESFIGNS